MARTKKTISTALVPTVVTENPEGTSGETTALVPLGSADLLLAGVTDFKITKDDLIELLVDEATAAIEAESAAAEAAHTACRRAQDAAERALTEARNGQLLAVFASEIKALRKLFSGADRVHVEASIGQRSSSEVNVLFLGPVLPEKEVHRIQRNSGHAYRSLIELLDLETQSKREYRLLQAKVALLNHDQAVSFDTPEIKALEEALNAANKAVIEANAKAHEAQQQERDLRYSSKKLRTQLIRKVLSSNANGGQVLTNVAGLSAQFVASLKKSRPVPC